jgi:hypothetical protein
MVSGYASAFELASVVGLAACVIAVVLVRHDRRSSVDVAEQPAAGVGRASRLPAGTGDEIGKAA